MSSYEFLYVIYEPIKRAIVPEETRMKWESFGGLDFVHNPELRDQVFREVWQGKVRTVQDLLKLHPDTPRKELEFYLYISGDVKEPSRYMQ